ncbi:TPA: hypothetical protein EYP84_00635, partial [Candidatus Bipolaricaulota bacterium]|nr:hypothetical protein [Candidatus Bipolaricaulota bacterium]
MLKAIENALFKGRLGGVTTRLVGKPGSLRLRLAQDTLGVMVIRALSMGLGFAGRWSGTLIE